MQPQGDSPLNTAYFDSLIAQVNMCSNGCSELQALVNKAFASLEAQVSAISSQTSSIYNQAEAIVEAFAAIGADPTPVSIVTFLQTLISQTLGPGYAAYPAYVLKLAALPTQLSSLTSAIRNAQARFKSCTISVPTITLPTLPSLPPLP